MDQYKPKPRRPYTGPPRPNLMKHETDIKKIHQHLDYLSQNLDSARDENRRLRSRLMQMEFELKKISNPKNKF
jgi:uncharacterized membrane protein